MPFWNVKVRVREDYFFNLEAADKVATETAAQQKVKDQKSSLVSYRTTVLVRSAQVNPDAI